MEAYKSNNSMFQIGIQSHVPINYTERLVKIYQSAVVNLNIMD